MLSNPIEGETLPLEPGETFVLFSDGVSEAMNERQEEFTQPRLIEVVAESRHQSASQIVHNIVAAVAEHRGGYPPNDDMTVVVVKIAETTTT